MGDGKSGRRVPVEVFGERAGPQELLNWGSHSLPSAVISGRLSLRRLLAACGSDLAAQGMTDQFRKADLLASRSFKQEFVDFAGETERHRHTAF